MAFLRSPFVVLLLWTAGLLAGAQFSKFAVFITEFRTVYPLVGDQVAWLLTLISMLGAIFGVVAGLITGRIGMQKVLLASLFLGGAMSLWQSTLPSFAMMSISRILEGVSHLGIVVAAPTLIAQISVDRWRATAMALWSTFFGVSFALVAGIGTIAVDKLGISGFFQIHAALMILTGIAIWANLQKDPSGATSANPAGVKNLFLGTVAAYKRPPILWPGLAWLFYTFTFLALLTILPEQMPALTRGETAAVMSLVGIVISMIAVPVFMRVLKAAEVVIVGFALAAGTIFLTMGLELPLRSIFVFAILGLIQGGTFAAVSQMNTASEDRALGFGIMAQTGNLGNLLGTPLLLFVLSEVELWGLWAIVAIVYVFAAAWLVWLFKKAKPGSAKR